MPTNPVPPALKGAVMAEDNTPNRSEEDDAPPLTVPLHDPLPLPPEISFTRPVLNRRSAPSQPPPTGSDPGPSGHGAGLAAGLSFVASILAGLLAGTWLDAHYIHSSTPWGTMVMTLAGTGVGFTNMFKLLSRGSRRKP